MPAIDPPTGRADRTHTRTRLRRFAAGSRSALVVPVASIVLTSSPLARASPCDDYKAVLAARIEATGVRGYSLEVVLANAAVPPGAKVIATCEAGARKFLYRRWGAAGGAAAGAAGAAPAGSAVPAAMARAAPGAREVPAVTALPASVPDRVRVPVPDANVAKPALVAVVAPPSVPAAASAGVVAAARPIAPAAFAPPPGVVADTATTATTAEVTPQPRASGFAAAHWQWIGALALAALVGGLWLWRARFSAYDKDGLPRGPRL